MPRTGKERLKVNADLNLMPLMNIIILLIPMLLLSAVFIEMRTIDMAPPPLAATASQPENVGLDLAIRIDERVYVVVGRGLPPVVVPRPTANAAAPGEDATRELGRALGLIATAHPDNHEVRIVAGPRTRYEEIVALMDVARAAGLPMASLEGAS